MKSKVIVIGSRAMNFNLGPIREIADTDIITTMDNFTLYISLLFLHKPSAVYPIQKGKKMVAKSGDRILEAEIAWPGSNQEQLINLVLNDPDSFYRETEGLIEVYPSLDVLYMLKMSHRYLRNSPSFLKTMSDINIMRERGAKFNPRYAEWYARREKETYYYKHPDLSVTKDAFFNPSTINYVFDHDSIHEAIKLFDIPVYQMFAVDGEQVKSDRNKFNVLSYCHKITAVYEESCVLALERHQIPNNYRPLEHRSFLIALEKVCTSITSGWFREFAWEHYHEVVAFKLRQYDYVSKFKTALNTNKVKPFGAKYE